MYSTPSGFKWRARGGRVSRFHWFKGSPESCCSPSLSPPCAKTLRTTGEPSPTPLPWKSIDFLEVRFNFVPYPFLSFSKTDFAITHIQCGHFVKLLLDHPSENSPSPLWSTIFQASSKFADWNDSRGRGRGAVVFILIYKCFSGCVSVCVSLNVLCKGPNFITWSRFW